MAVAPTAYGRQAQRCKVLIARLFNGRPQRHLFLQRTYLSTTPHLWLPRSRGYQDWPSFRAVSKQDRMVKEHNLFDPVEYIESYTARLPAPKEDAKKRTTLPYSATTTAILEQELLYRATRIAPSRKTLKLIEHLILDRNVAPNAAHYEALILTNADPQNGSADNIRWIMTEMDDTKIPFNVNLYTAILKSLVVHPDIELLDHVVEECNAMWIELDQEMLQLICAIYIRAGMLEIAEDYLDQIEGKSDNKHVVSEPVDPLKNTLWLYVLLLRSLALSNDWDGVIRICYRLHDDTSLGIPLAMRQIDVPYEFWSWMLEMAADARDVWTCDWIWRLWVRRAYITPNAELCNRLLTMFQTKGYESNVKDAEYVLRLHTSPGDTASNMCEPTDRAECSRTLYLWGLPRRCHKAELQALLGQHGEVTEVQHVGGRPELAWVKFAHEEHARAALEATDGLVLEGKPIRLRSRFAKWPATRTSPTTSAAQDQVPSLREQYNHPFLLDTIAVLTEETDAGRAWPRVLRGRQLREQRRLNTITRRQAVGAERRKEQLIDDAKRTFPSAILHDIEVAANARSDATSINLEAVGTQSGSTDRGNVNLISSGPSTDDPPHMSDELDTFTPQAIRNDTSSTIHEDPRMTFKAFGSAIRRKTDTVDDQESISRTSDSG